MLASQCLRLNGLWFPVLSEKHSMFFTESKLFVFFQKMKI